MTGQNQKKQDENNNGFPVAATIVGAVVGAGIAVAGAVALSDKKNREKVKQVLTNAKDKATDYMEDMQAQAQDKNDEAKGKFAEIKEKIENAANSARGSFDSGVKDAEKAVRAK